MPQIAGMSGSEIAGMFGVGGFSMGTAFFLLQVLLALAILGVIGYFAFRFMSYNIEVRKYLLKGQNVIEVTDLAKKFKTKSGFKCLKLLGAKIKLPIPSPKYFRLGSKKSFFGLMNRSIQIINYVQFGEYDFALLNFEFLDNFKKIKRDKSIEDKEEREKDYNKKINAIEEKYENKYAEKMFPISEEHLKDFMVKLRFEAIPQDVFGTAVQEVRLAPQRFQRKVPWMQMYGWHIAGFMILMFLLIAIWIITKNWGAAMNAGIGNIQKVAALGGAAPGGFG